MIKTTRADVIDHEAAELLQRITAFATLLAGVERSYTSAGDYQGEYVTIIAEIIGCVMLKANREVDPHVILGVTEAILPTLRNRAGAA